MPRYLLPRALSGMVALADQGALPLPLRFPVALNSERSTFVDQDGNPCFACGDAPQYLIQQLSKPDMETYLFDRAARGINVLWMIAADKVYQSNPPNNLAGDAPFSGADFTNFNEPYWAHVDHVMRRCLAYGITVLLMPLFVGLKGTEGYLTSVRDTSDTVIEGYGTFLAERYKGFPNLIWLIGGDADPNNAVVYGKLDKLAMAIKAADPLHLMTMEANYVLETGGPTPNGGYSSVDAHTIAYGSIRPWLDINWVYEPLATVVSGAQRCYSQGLPCLLGEDWYELEHSTTGVRSRAEGYGAVLGGCTLGRLFGNGAIWPFNSPNAGNGINAGPPTWQSQLNSAGSVGQQLLGKLFRSRSFQLLVPDTSNVVMTAGADSGSVCARTSDGRTIIVYLPSRERFWERLISGGRSVTIDMGKITDATNLATCNWYNPGTGTVTAGGDFANSGMRSFKSPDTGDWVLVIDSAEARFRAPGT
ncbi:apiosidase-like domain-containing protein [Bradyrhizobium archetypum]|uniref:DUF4038 domain-containing protein n=1 Tax=Bradyrhizobium archetypum TaxID=2721160 RepID=A0A7Y4H6N6_9BRAD|nr:DUF4038 domain-containing protein [Bradyrhizobium archetypum]NOJ47697.1 DUF4038 domain-containing protein [Bradyrhizobium archetypum]